MSAYDLSPDKAIVKLLDDQKYDCNQEAVITALINKKQINFEAQWPHIFHGEKLALAIKDKDPESDATIWTTVDICVQPSSETRPSKSVQVWCLYYLVDGIMDFLPNIFCRN